MLFCLSHSWSPNVCVMQSGIRILLAHGYKLGTSLPCGYYFLPSSTGYHHYHTDQGIPSSILCIPTFKWLTFVHFGFKMIRIPTAGSSPLFAKILISQDFCWDVSLVHQRSVESRNSFYFIVLDSDLLLMVGQLSSVCNKEMHILWNTVRHNCLDILNQRLTVPTQGEFKL